MGLESGQLPWTSVTVSSVLNSDNIRFGKHHLALNARISNDARGGGGGWRPATNTSEEYVKVRPGKYLFQHVPITI